MNDGKYPIISINYESDKDSDFSEKKHNKEFGFRKYEKFKSKDENYYKIKSIKGAESKVKNLLSIFIKNYEIEKEKENSDIFYDSQKSKEIYIFGNKNKKRLKKVKTSVSNKKENNLLRSSSFNISFNENRNRKIANASERYNHQKKNSQKRKVGFNIRPVKHNHESYKDLSNHNNTNRKKSKKNMINEFIEKAKTLTSNILNRNKTGVKVSKKGNRNSGQGQRNSNQISDFSNNDQIIKKTQSLYKNDNYLNFKNDNIFINKSNNNNCISLKSSLKKKKGILKNKKKMVKNDIFNDSNHNSIQSDLSDYYLNKKTVDFKGSYKESDSIRKDQKSSLVTGNSIQKNLTNILNLPESSDIASKQSTIIRRSMSPKRPMPIKSFIGNKNKSKFERATTSMTDVKKVNYDKISKVMRLDTQIKSLKEQLKRSLVIGSEELDIKNIEKKNMKKNSEKMNSFVLNYKNNHLKLVNKDELSKSNRNLDKMPQMLKVLMGDENKKKKN